MALIEFGEHELSRKSTAGAAGRRYVFFRNVPVGTREKYANKIDAEPGRDITLRQDCTYLEVKMRYEVRQQDEKWIVWDTVKDCAVKGAAGFPKLTAANVMRHPSIAGLLVMKPNAVASLAAEVRPMTFWTQQEAQRLADFLNDIERP